MNAFQINISDFKHMINVLKFSVDKAGIRPVLKMIDCYVSNGILTAKTCDGYRIHRVSVPCVVVEGSFDGPFLLPMINLNRINRSRILRIEVSENEVAFDFEEDKWIKKVSNLHYPNVEKGIPTDEPKFEIYVNPKYLKDAFDAFKNDDHVKIEFRGGIEPIVIKRRNNDFISVLPKRVDTKY